MRVPGRRPRGPYAAVLAVGLLACNSAPTAVALPPLDVVIASGDGQFGVVGQQLLAPLRVVVQSSATGSPRENVSVVWVVTQGNATVVGVPTTVSDSTGSTEVRIQVGTTAGEVRVTASVAGQRGANADFHLFGVNPPSLQQVAPTAAAAGDTVTLTGTGFSTIPTQNVVLFSGFRGRVVSATSTQLRVQVPACMPARAVHARVQLGTVPAPDSLPFTVAVAGPPVSLQVGGVLDVADDAGHDCVVLDGGTDARYLLLAYASSAVGAARHPFSLVALSSLVPPAAGAGTGFSRAVASGGIGSEPQWTWDQRVRELEGRALAAGRVSGGEAPAGAGPARVGPVAVPSVGERRTFNVLNRTGGLDRVDAIARHVGSRAAIFVDETAPPPPAGLTDAQLASLATRFDQVIHPEVTAAFGAVSDLDANQRVIILMTPVVNRLTPRGSSGYVGGFFYGVDLLAGETGSNQAEVFYALVPDPNGQFSDAITASQVLQAIPAVLAHEFQHMVHFNERILVRGAPGQEALWLSEALAQMAEELVARAYGVLGDGTSRDLFRAGAKQRARRYLQGTDTVSVVVTAGQGSLAERGAGFLHVLYLEDQRGPSVLGGLTRTTLTGVANVEAQAGLSWQAVLADWWAAMWLDGPGVETGRLVYPSIDLRSYLSPFNLTPQAVGPSDFSSTGTLWSSSVRYHIVSPPAGGTLSVRLGGAAGGPSAAQAGLRLRLVRVQ